MRTSHLARAAVVRTSTFHPARPPTWIHASRLPVITGKTPHLRQMASAATRISQEEPSSPVVSTAEVESYRYEALRLDVEAVDGLLRNGVGGSDLWIERLRTVKEDLATPRSRRIAVVGDSISGAKDVVSSLLQDPISDPASGRQALLARHVDTSRPILSIGYDRTMRETAQALSLPLSWLEHAECELLEISSENPDEIITASLRSDHIVLVVDAIRLLETSTAASLRSLVTSGRPATIVINGPLPQSASLEGLRHTIAQQAARPETDIVLTDSTLALQAFAALSEGLQRTDASPSTRSRAFEVFQHTCLKSNIGQLQSRLTSNSSHDFQLATAASTLSIALDHIKSTIALDRQALVEARQVITDLRRSSRQATSHAKNISVINRAIEGGRIEGGVDEELRRARHDIQQMFDGKLSWLGLVGRLRVDDVGSEMGAYVSQQFGVELERRIVYETGQLSQLRRNLDLQTDATVRKLASLSNHPLSSPILVNHLATLSLSIPDLSPSTLLFPLRRRRRQLIDIPINRLQSSARRALLTTFALATTGVFSSWWAYVPPVAAISASTASALGILSVVSAAALGQKSWATAQTKFWKEWDRTTKMLRGDLQEDFVAALDTRVVAKTDSAADGLDRLLSKREERLDYLEELARRQAAALHSGAQGQ